MNEVLETVLIKNEKGEARRINLSSFDPEKHEIYGVDEAPKETKSGKDFDRDAAMKFLDNAGIEYKGNISNVKLEALVAETQQNAKDFNIQEKDGKFIVCDKDGDQVGSDAYDTREDAETMLELIAGK